MIDAFADQGRDIRNPLEFALKQNLSMEITR